ncbi:cellulose binding iron reductase [Coprinopsis cinerea okayama7|uniref:Cellulose binding iron reductase n=1 Tax=Coprinopsis cinerea (strain Okayama-7 / 130 / ATCC MYA-4618 / FGSC 9003) TaxID=240176 RepID=A8P0W8_COPC7|nr:cellulose binding iron reductase [Coprinopsis cinerea okayama7\|eukprot:XP_001837984.2 cellulose binding iron reductase [Coprinopsis cinerea okayama7\
MVLLVSTVLTLVFNVLLASAQATRWCDDLTSVCFQRYYEEHLDTAWGYLFPPTDRGEFVGFFIAPVRSGWIGNSLGGSMRGNPLVVGWLDDDNKPVISARITPCNCTTWTGGSGGINLNGTHLFGYATHAAIKPIDPSNPNSSLYQHTEASLHTLDTVAGRSDAYDTDLGQLTNAPPLVPPTPTTTTTGTGPTPTEPALCPGAPRPTYPLYVASGWKVTPVLGRLAGAPRQIMVDSRGNLLVLQRDIGVTGHTVDENGMFNPFHITRSIHVSRKFPDYISLSVGSDGNLDIPSMDPALGRSQIRVFDMRHLAAHANRYNGTHGKVFGYGLRNDVGIAEDRAGNVFSVENSLDDAHRVIEGVRVDIHDDNPAEKIYRLGKPTSPNQRFFGGYPYCYSVWEEKDIPNANLKPGQYFVQDPNGPYSDAWCNINAEKPVAILPPHAAPLDIKFGVHQDDGNLYVALHGSSARTETLGYKVVAIPGSYSPSGEWTSDLDLVGTKTGTIDIFFNEDETKCRSGCFRPCGMSFAPNGNLYVSSDTSGEVFLLKPPFQGPPVIPTTSLPQIPSTTSSGPQATQTIYGQCGGTGYSGPTVCAGGSRCKQVNPHFSQCLPLGAWWRDKEGGGEE